MNRWTTSNKAIYNINYHLIWCPKYRRKILIGDIEIRLKELFLEKATKLNIIIEQMEIMPDHVHLFVKSLPIYPPQFIVGQLKGYSSKILRNEFPKLKSKLPCLWSRSYYCESVGHISEDIIKKYIKDQKGI
jgi:putative transposase